MKSVEKGPLRTIEWIPDRPGEPVPGRVRFIDQTLLPVRLRFVETTDVEDLCRAIRTLQVRGAPAIGIAAAMGVALAAQQAKTLEEVRGAVECAARRLGACRPTAVNLFGALERMKKTARAGGGARALAEEALRLRDEDAAMCRAIGEHGVALLGPGQTVLTHCNAGGLAASERGTALAPVYTARERGMDVRVIARETRPLLQGARLTAWELQRAGIEVTLICDHAAAVVLREGKADCVMVGADRIAANGDAANKIGTYGLALLARAHGVPFYVLAPSTTLDPTLPDGARIPIEERAPEEITRIGRKRIAPVGVRVYAPAFDVTPAELITALVTEKGVLRPPYGPALQALAP